ncbi:MAG TPA: gas vesicle protein GvpO [Streptosporangiaceae bacterium]
MAQRQQRQQRRKAEPEAEPEDLETDEVLDEEEPEEEPADEPEEEPADEPEEAGSRRAMTAGEAAKAALSQIAELTAKQPEGVTGVERTEDGWTIGVELVEDQRIPSSSDILASYETTIDADGELVSYRRVRRYARGRGDTEGS